jgi:hypothetical protein
LFLSASVLTTYSSSSACANVIWQTGDVVWVTHEDGDLDGGECVAGECLAGTTAKSVVHDLTTLD